MDEEREMHLEWQPVKGAVGYYIEFREKDGKSLFTKTIVESMIDIKLAYSNYQYRIAIIYNNNIISDWSDWFSLTVVPLVKPEIESIEPDIIYLKKKFGRITIKGNKFLNNIKIFLISGNEKLSIEQKELIDSKTLVINIPHSIKPGEYDVVVTNPGGLEDIKKEYFYVLSDSRFSGKIFGVEGGYNYTLSGADPAYSGSAGGSLYIEDYSPGKGIKLFSFLNKYSGSFLGLKISYFSFLQPADNFGRSDMVQGLVYFGYDFRAPVFKMLHISPFIGYKHYYRRYIYKGEESAGGRPVLSSGLIFKYELTKKIFMGPVIEHNYFFEINPVQTLGLFLRMGHKL